MAGTNPNDTLSQAESHPPRDLRFEAVQPSLPKRPERSIYEITEDFQIFNESREASKQFVPADFAEKINIIAVYLGRLNSFLEAKEQAFHQKQEGDVGLQMAELKRALHAPITKEINALWNEGLKLIPNIPSSGAQSERISAEKIREACSIFTRDSIAPYLPRDAKGFHEIFPEATNINPFLGGTGHLRDVRSGVQHLEKDGQPTTMHAHPMIFDVFVKEEFDNFCARREQDLTKVNPEFLEILQEKREFYCRMMAFFEESGIAVIGRTASGELNRTHEQWEVVNHPEFFHKTLREFSLRFENAAGHLNYLDPEINRAYVGATHDLTGIISSHSSFVDYSRRHLARMPGDVGIISILLDPENRKYNWYPTREPGDQETLLGDIITSFFANGNSYQAHRNRMEMLGVIYDEAFREVEGPVKIATLGCGNGKDLKDLVTKLSTQPPHSLEIILQDIAAQALNTAEANILSAVRSSDITIRKQIVNAFFLAARGKSREGGLAVLTCAGLFDYIPNEAAQGQDTETDVKLLKAMMTGVVPGGLVITTRVGEDIEYGVTRETEGAWPLIQGDGIDMIRLATQAGLVVRKDLSDVRPSHELLMVRSPNEVTRTFPDWTHENVTNTLRENIAKLQMGEAMIIPDATRTNWFLIAKASPVKVPDTEDSSTIN